MPVIIDVRQSTAVTIVVGRFVDATDGHTPETGLTINSTDVKLSVNGAAFAVKQDTTACTHLESGMYACPLGISDVGSVGLTVLSIAVAGARPVEMWLNVLQASYYDAKYTNGLNNLKASDVWVNATRTLTAFNFIPSANVTKVAGTSVDSIDDFKATGFSTLTTTDIETAVGTALTTYDAATGTDISGLSIPTAIENADALLTRNVSNVEATAGEHTFATIVLAILESQTADGTWTIYRTDGSTVHATKTVTTDADADPITGVS